MPKLIDIIKPNDTNSVTAASDANLVVYPINKKIGIIISRTVAITANISPNGVATNELMLLE